GEHPEDSDQPMDSPPARGADPVPAVVGEAERSKAVAGDDPDPGPERAVGAGERDRDPSQARVEERVAEQGDAVEADQPERGERERLVKSAKVALARALSAGAHHQPERDARAGGEQRRAPGGAAGDPEQVRADVHPASTPSLPGLAATTSTERSSRTSTPP